MAALSHRTTWSQQASTIHSFDELDWNKDVELKTFFPLVPSCDGVSPFAYRELGLGGFCFRWVFVGWTRIRLFCLAAQAALPLALHFLSFFSTSFFCRVG
ncbi:hypothetical protein N5P37_010331 [Trichoderma harzianum]|nr:hypothetical protein N5P37_010331 [Trichoderma harzianum]